MLCCGQGGAGQGGMEVEALKLDPASPPSCTPRICPEAWSRGNDPAGLGGSLLPGSQPATRSEDGGQGDHQMSTAPARTESRATYTAVTASWVAQPPVSQGHQVQILPRPKLLPHLSSGHPRVSTRRVSSTDTLLLALLFPNDSSHLTSLVCAAQPTCLALARLRGEVRGRAHLLNHHPGKRDER